MSRLIPTIVLLIICLISPSLYSQNTSGNNYQMEINEKDVSINTHHEGDNHNHSMVELDEHYIGNVLGSEAQKLLFIAISLDEIISSEDSIDFNCTGGFCMKKSHTHKKGLSSQRQLFDYFMRISA